MSNDSGKNVVVADQLEALAIAAKNYTQNEIAKGGASAATFTLDTVPSTVEGAVWLDNSSKKLAVRHNNRIYRLPFEPLAEVTAVNVAPSSVAVMQGQSATATVSAVGNDAVTGLSYGLSGAPTWITISDDLILIQPSDNDLGIANVQVIAQDTGSDAMSSAILRAEAKLRPIIDSLAVIPPAVTVQQGQSAFAGISAVANAAVTDLSYSINGASSWISISDNSIIVAPTDNDLGSNTVDVIAYDTNSSASAATQFVATAEARLPRILDVVPASLPFAFPWDKGQGGINNLFNAVVEDGISRITSVEKLQGLDWLTVSTTGYPLKTQFSTTKALTASDMGEYLIEIKYTPDVGLPFVKEFTLNVTSAENYFYVSPTSFTLKTSGSSQDAVLVSLRAPSDLTNLNVSLTGIQPASSTLVSESQNVSNYKSSILHVRYIPDRQSIGSTASMSISAGGNDYCEKITKVVTFYNSGTRTCNKVIKLS